MPLTPGTRLKEFEILDSLGAGGMGEVYRARDTKLGREVAIKVLPEELSKDRERRDRFEREAKLLASLNHPAIATLYGFEDGFLVMELVEGETLAERIAQGPLLVDEAIPLFIQITEGVEAAHDKTVIHRDLKPANLKIGPDGKPKILDFGLAKAFAGGKEAAPDSSQSPTLTKGTALGAIMGTASYMSPEQARGKPVDKRTDIWAFGCCLYEALTGKKVFGGDNVTDVLAAVVHKEPAWDALPASTPWRVRDLLRRLLQKDARLRVHDIADARLELQESLTNDEATTPRPLEGGRRLVAPVLISAIVTGLIVTALTRRDDSSSNLTSRFAIHLPRGDRLPGGTPRASVALSRDGRTLVYEGERDGIPQLFRRSMDELEPVPIAGTELARHPVISPDGRWVAFFAAGELRKVSLLGGAPVSLGPAPTFWGATWTENDAILFGGASGLVQIPAGGGDQEVVTNLGGRLVIHSQPQLLPDGKSVLFTILDRDRHADATLQPRNGEDRKFAPRRRRCATIPVRSSDFWPEPYLMGRAVRCGSTRDYRRGCSRGGRRRGRRIRLPAIRSRARRNACVRPFRCFWQIHSGAGRPFWSRGRNAARAFNER